MYTWICICIRIQPLYGYTATRKMESGLYFTDQAPLELSTYFMRILYVSLCFRETKNRRNPRMKSQCQIWPLKSDRKAEKFVLLKISC